MKHKAVRKAVRKFAETELGPISHEIDRESRFPWEVIEKMRPLNYFGLQVPQKYGGAELDTISYAITIEELFRNFPMTIPVVEKSCAYPCPKKYPRIVCVLWPTNAEPTVTRDSRRLKSLSAADGVWAAN
jgi:hypothetical protein